MTHLTPDDLKWVACALKYPHIDYKSNWGNHSVLTYDTYFKYNSTNRFCNMFMYIETGPNYEAYAGYFFSIQSSFDSIEGSLLVELAIDCDTLQYSSRCGGLHTFDKTAILPDYIKVCPLNLRLGEYHFKECLIVDSAFNGKTIPAYTNRKHKRQICKFIISKEYGLIYYKFADGEEFTIDLAKLTSDSSYIDRVFWFLNQ